MKAKLPEHSDSKILLTLALGLLLLPSLCRASSSTDVIVVAEQTEPGKNLPTPSPGHPSFYLAFDAGYLEAGDPIAGLKPPTPAAVGEALHDALGNAGYDVATTADTPSLVLIYHYGSLRPGRNAVSPRSSLRLGSNLTARLNLIAPKEWAERAQNQILFAGRSANRFVVPHVQDTLDLIQDARYFLIVSAYDYADLIQQKPTLLWRVKLSALDNSGDMSEVVPALAGAGAPYLGRNFLDRKFGSLHLRPAKDLVTDPTASPARYILPRNAVEKLDPNVIRDLLQFERLADFGGYLPYNDKATPAAGAGLPAIPPALAQDIKAYQTAKNVLQAALAERLKTTPPGPDTRRTIDAFNAEQAEHIRQLEQTRENIRSELARIASQNSPSTDKSLDTLLSEFGAELQRLEIETVPASL